MSLWTRLFGKKSPPRQEVRSGVTGFNAGSIDRFNSSWAMVNVPIDRQLFQSIRLMRSRCRDLAINNDYAKRYLSLLNTHVIGPKGILLAGAIKRRDGLDDREANDLLEDQWQRWCRRGVCDVAGKLSFRDIQALVLKGCARDGEAIIRLVYDSKNPWGLSLQVMDPMLLDELYNETKPNAAGNTVRMGVEVDQYERPVAYYFRQNYDTYGTTQIGDQLFLRVPADEIVHVYMNEFPTQTRGYPWLHTGVNRLQMLSGYEDAEVVAARIAASKMGFMKQTMGASGYAPSDHEQDGLGRYQREISAGSIEVLPEGVDFTPWDPTHPAGNYGPFVKACLRGISSGLGVSYNSLANDCENVNFSSLRSALLEERDNYQVIQNFLIENLNERIFSRWLTAAILSRKIAIKPSEEERYASVKWIARRWQWVDPLKDVNANIAAINAGLKSRSEVIAEQGRNIDDVLHEFVAENAKAEKVGVSFKTETGNDQVLTLGDDEDELDADRPEAELN